MAAPDDELARRVRALEAERLRPVPKPPSNATEAAMRRIALIEALDDDDEPPEEGAP